MKEEELSIDETTLSIDLSDATEAVKESRLIKINGKLFLKSPAFESGVNVETVLNIMSGRAKRSIPNTFIKYMKEIYNIEKKGYNTVIHTIWGLYRDKIIEMILEADPDLIPYYKRATYLNLNESKEDKSKNYREKVYRDLVKKTKWRDDSYREIDVDGVCNKINSYIEWGSSGAYFYVIPPCIEDLLTNVYGLTYSEIDRFFWDWYGEHIIYMLINKKEYLPPHIKRLNLSYLNESVESVEKNKPYLDKVVDKLKHYTTFVASKSPSFSTFYTAQIPFTGGQKWYIEWFSGSLETGYGFKDGFKKEMRDVYGLTPEEIEYVYMKFTSYLIKEFKDRQTKVHVVKD